MKVNAFNPMICAYYNADFDGDSLSISSLASNQAYRDAEKMKIYTNVKKYFDPDSFIIEFTHESVYTMHHVSKLISKNWNPESEIVREFDNFRNVKIKTGEINELLDKTVYIRNLDIKMPYFFALLNKAVWQFGGEEKVIFEVKHYTKKNLNPHIMNKILSISKNNKDFVNRIWKVNTFLNELSSVYTPAVASFELDDFVIEEPEVENIKKQFVAEPVLGFHQNIYLFKKVIIPYLEKHKSGDNILNKVFKSGSRLKAVQLMKSTACVGIPTDVYGNAIEQNIQKSLLEGLNPDELFVIANGARMALAARESLIPKSGEMQRIIMNALGFIILDHNLEDCGDKIGFRITIKDKKHLKSLQGRYIAQAPEHLNLPKDYIINQNDEFLIGETVYIRSPMTCKHKDFKICKKCWGIHRPHPTKKNISFVGPLAASAVVEQLLQSGLRLHHTGGSWQMENINEKLLDIISESEFKMVEINKQKITAVKMSPENLQYYKEYVEKIYEGDIEFQEHENGWVLVIPHKRLPNQDSSKVIKNFSSLIYRSKTKEDEDFLSPEELYSKAIDIIFEGAYLLSVYLEVILSAVMYDENMHNYRYLEDRSNVYQQISIKNLLGELDPKLSLFHKLNNNSIKKLYENESNYNLDHFLKELFEYYK